MAANTSLSVTLGRVRSSWSTRSVWGEFPRSSDWAASLELFALARASFQFLTPSSTSFIITDGRGIRLGWPSKISLKKSPPLWVDSWVCQISRFSSRTPRGFTGYWL